MNTMSWAEKEIELACEQENPEYKNEWDYGCACYESALKAYNSLMEDGHSGYSIGVTKNILMRLIEGKPLTPIEDTLDVWNELHWGEEDDDVKQYQCSRMSSLFKTVYPDGRIVYSDTNRVSTTYVDNPGVWWSSGQARDIIDELFPITMPYWPVGSYSMYAEDFLVDPANGDFDTVGYLYAINPSGEKIEINRYFGEVDGKFIEIGFDEYCERKRSVESV